MSPLSVGLNAYFFFEESALNIHIFWIKIWIKLNYIVLKFLRLYNVKKMTKQYTSIVPFMTTPLKGCFVVFSKQLLKGKVKFGDCPAGLEPPCWGQKQEKNYCENTTKRPLRGVVMKGTIPKYTYNTQSIIKS